MPFVYTPVLCVLLGAGKDTHLYLYIMSQQIQPILVVTHQCETVTTVMNSFQQTGIQPAYQYICFLAVFRCTNHRNSQPTQTREKRKVHRVLSSPRHPLALQAWKCSKSLNTSLAFRITWCVCIRYQLGLHCTCSRYATLS